MTETISFVSWITKFNATKQNSWQRRGNAEAMRKGIQISEVVSEERMEINEVSGQIVDACITVHKAFGPGLLESVYESAQNLRL